jgi:hypothetical protein
MDRTKFENHNREAFERAVREECAAIADLLIEKNRRYGASVFYPLSVFSRAGWEEAIRVRLDDKLARLARSGEAVSMEDGEDTIADVIGYLLLWRVGLQLFGSDARKRGMITSKSTAAPMTATNKQRR